MADLVLGPMLRFVSDTEATVWLETDVACEVAILGRRTATFRASGHHYAIVAIEGLEPGSSHEYEVHLDGELRWPMGGDGFPPSRIRTLPPRGPLELVFGSCRVASPHDVPYTLGPDECDLGLGVDALYALAVRVRDQDAGRWPHMLLLLGDQVYADKVSGRTAELIRARRDVGEPPGEQVADFEEYTWLYREAWGQPTLRWLFSVLPTGMIFDDHDVHDDWNISEAWLARMRAQPWWEKRIAGALSSYWIYQHLGNLAPAELAHDALLAEVKSAEDAGSLLHAFAAAADQQGGGGLWSFSRDLAGSRLVVLDGREGRILSAGRREMFDEQEWLWVEEQTRGDFDHLLLANTLPVLLTPTFHYLEAWSEAVCAGRWGRWAARRCEKLRQALDLEHWAAFHHSFSRLVELVREVGVGRRGSAPASIVLLGGDVHHAYLHEVAFRYRAGVRSAVYQAVCSPFRNPLDRRERALLTLGRRSRLIAHLVRGLAHAAGVSDPEIRWRLVQEPTFENQLATLRLDGREAWLKIECARRGHGSHPELQTSLERQLA